MRSYILGIFFCKLFIGISFSPAGAQHVELKFVEVEKNTLIIHYDLLDSVEGRFFTVRLYSSQDGFLNAMNQVRGDVGLEVKSGTNKKMIWSAQDELGATFQGKVSVEVRARLFIPFINTENINAYKLFKRKRKYNLTWSGGTQQNVLNFDLMKEGRRIFTFPNIANVGHQVFEFPAFVRPGKGYSLRISDSKNKDETVFTQPFRIKRKMPLLLKAIPIAGLGAVALSLSNARSESDLPDPQIIK